ncbi:MAG: TIGR03905 family TSCPD domain-containing protein [Bacilli bacterium]|nr:TIGR03905 family TSCPD domain-containing protein [Acholeplasmataceae bacterium]MDY2902033.1 TIGR03905 family TSCPD domain-containing protein [Bacilli bacterium]
MKHISYNTHGTCARIINFDLDDNNVIHNVTFIGGCNGNLKAISKLIEGQNAIDVANLLKGNLCGNRNTSCADQLSNAILDALK